LAAADARRPESYLDRVIAQAFDGSIRPRRRFRVEAVAPVGPRRHGGFDRAPRRRRKRNPPIVVQNAEELIEDLRVLDAIDGIAGEDPSWRSTRRGSHQA
jgi:hypothetical protein